MKGDVSYAEARREAELRALEAMIDRSRERADRCEPPAPHDPATCPDCAIIPELELRALAGDR